MNALPQLAAANVNCRVLPDDSIGYVTATLKHVIADTAVTLTIDGTPHIATASPMRDDLMSAVNGGYDGVVARRSGGADDGDGCDGRFVPARGGIPTYGVQGFFYDRDDIRFHGRDERLKVQSFYEGQTFLYDLVKRLAGAPTA